MNARLAKLASEATSCLWNLVAVVIILGKNFTVVNIHCYVQLIGEGEPENLALLMSSTTCYSSGMYVCVCMTVCESVCVCMHSVGV